MCERARVKIPLVPDMIKDGPACLRVAQLGQPLNKSVRKSFVLVRMNAHAVPVQAVDEDGTLGLLAGVGDGMREVDLATLIERAEALGG